MNVCIRLPLRLPKMQDQKSLTCCWLSCSRWGRECVSLVFEYKGGQYNSKGQQYTNVNILWLVVGYLNATTNIHSENWNWRLEPTGLAKHSKIPGLTGPGADLVGQNAVDRVVERVWNWTEHFCQYKPRPLAGYLDTLLILFLGREAIWKSKNWRGLTDFNVWIGDELRTAPGMGVFVHMWLWFPGC
jgi:hypothetical protein